MLDFILKRDKAVALLWVMIMIFGIYATVSIPKEFMPNINIPIVQISTKLAGISASDCERNISTPLEKEINLLNGVKEVISNSMENLSLITVIFDSNTFDRVSSIANLREKLDNVIHKLPKDASKPEIQVFEGNIVPALMLTISSNLGEEHLLETASELKKYIDKLPSVMETKMSPDRKKILKIALDPEALIQYKININTVLNSLEVLKQSITSTQLGRTEFSVSIDQNLDTIDDIKNIYIMGRHPLKIKDIATVKIQREKAETIRRRNQKNTVNIEIQKIPGSNLLEIISKVKDEIEKFANDGHEDVEINIAFDSSQDVISALSDLKNNIAFAVILVVILMWYYIGFRMSLMTAFTIPGSILMSILFMYMVGYTMNIIVLFGLIMSVGMIVDAAVIVNEYADRKMISGLDARTSYYDAAKKMAWPVISSTGTTVIVLVPLLFWPTDAGKFMRYLPITLITTLSSSVIMSLLFTPVLGSIVGKVSTQDNKKIARLTAIDNGEIDSLEGWYAKYFNILEKLTKKPGKTLLIAGLCIALSYCLYGFFGRGTQFLPTIEPMGTHITILSNTKLMLNEKRDIILEAESLICNLEGVMSCHSHMSSRENDTVGEIDIKFIDWKKRKKTIKIKDLVNKIESSLASIKGVQLYVDNNTDTGAPKDADIKIAVSAPTYDKTLEAAGQIKEMLSNIEGTENIKDDTHTGEIEWSVKLDKGAASLRRISPTDVVLNIILANHGLKTSQYMGSEQSEAIDVIVSLPDQHSTLTNMMNMKFTSQDGRSVHLSDFVKVKPNIGATSIQKVDGEITIYVTANVSEGFLANNIAKKLRHMIDTSDKLKEVKIKLKGEQEGQEEISMFLLICFFASMLGVIFILLLQFNSFYQSFIILSAVFLSTAGVMLGLLLTYQAFIIIMSGIGIISLAGIVVNNNILMIDAYNDYISEGDTQKRAAIRAALSRLRAILITSGTTILGLLPMIFKITVDFINFEITYNAPPTQWWQSLSTAIAGGLLFTTLFSLLLTPVLLSIKKPSFLNTKKE